MIMRIVWPRYMRSCRNTELHITLLFGDFNEDIACHKSIRRKNNLNQLISENELTTSINGNTYVNPK